MQAECRSFQLDETLASVKDHDVIERRDQSRLLARAVAPGLTESPRFDPFGVDAAALAPAPTRASRGRVLVVDDDGAFALTCARILDAAGYAVRVANDGQTAIGLAAKEHFDAMVTDINLPDQNGIQVMQGVRGSDTDMPIILVTGQPDLEVARAALEWDAISYLTKPVSATQLERELERALNRRHTTSRMRILDDHDKTQEDMSQRFSRALRGLWMAFQPIVSWSRKAVVGYQVVVQSTEPSLPTLADLSRAARELNQIAVLGRSVRSWLATLMGSGYSSGTMFVELHPADLYDGDLYDAGAPLAPFAQHVCFEINQIPPRAQMPEFRAHLERLRILGYLVAIGDINAGESGLGSLATIEPNAVKLDMTVFRDTENLRVKRTLIRALVTLCEDLESPLIATGVDSEDERALFTGFGGDLMQGLRFAEPAFPFPTPTF
jgi:EAL domain-containing protein (putative c-di-GMP-specific phosphodiesterase class I)